MSHPGVWCCRACLVALLVVAGVTSSAWASTGREVQARIDTDVAAGRPVVVHVVVALCDNANQGIVPVPRALGDGQNPKTNLYWGALYGVRTHLPRASNWARIDAVRAEDQRILDRVVFHANLKRNETSVPVYIVADAWDGANIREALHAYLRMAAGDSAERVEVTRGSGSLKFRAGGASHLLVFVGHNGLMNFSLSTPAPPEAKAEARSAMVLACASKPYFLDRLQAIGAHPLLLTTGLMAPEAYTLDAAIRSFVGGGATDAVIEAAAGAYNRYQKCGLKGARRLFVLSTAPPFSG
jgi:hypothetical protein